MSAIAKFSALDLHSNVLHSNELEMLHNLQAELVNAAQDAIRRIPEDTNLHELHEVLTCIAGKVADIAKHQPNRAIESASELLDNAADEVNDYLTDALREGDTSEYARDLRALINSVR